VAGLDQSQRALDTVPIGVPRGPYKLAVPLFPNLPAHPASGHRHPAGVAGVFVLVRHHRHTPSLRTGNILGIIADPM